MARSPGLVGLKATNEVRIRKSLLRYVILALDMEIAA